MATLKRTPATTAPTTHRPQRRQTTRSPSVAHGTTMVQHTVHHRCRSELPPSLITLLVIVAVAATANAEHYTNQFAVRVAAVAGGAADPGRVADRVARKHGFVNRGKVSLIAGTTARSSLVQMSWPSTECRFSS